MTEFPILTPTLQIGFYQRLIDSRERYLLPALLNYVGSLNISKIDAELLRYVPNERLAFLAKRGLRGELVFPIPYILSNQPTLLGYYRLLLGFSQKEFYKPPFSRFKMMEDAGNLSTQTRGVIEDLCISLIESSWILINSIPELSTDILNSLTLLTIGPQFRGSRNNNLGTEAIRTVFALIKAIVSKNIKEESQSHFLVESAVGRLYRIEFSPDPDIAIRQELTNGEIRNRIAIEIKGGTDYSNIHNRLGETEKSHQKAKLEGFTQFWTVINVQGLDNRVWKRETPTTTELFTLEGIGDLKSDEHERFKEYLVSEIGI